MLKKILLVNKGLVFIIFGIIVLIFRDDLMKYLYLIVSLPILVIAIQELAYEIVIRSYKNPFNNLGVILLKITLSIVMLIRNSPDDLMDFFIVCVLWGIVVILSATMAINKAFYELNEKKISSFVFEMAISTAEIVFAILLILDPQEHVSFHIILLGIEMLLTGSKEIIALLYSKNHDNSSGNIVIDELVEKIEKLDTAEYNLLKNALEKSSRIVIKKEKRNNKS